MTQYHYLDESGGPGLNRAAKSSSHFALAMVQLPDDASLSELADVRHTLHLPSAFEFKYHTTTPVQKTAFFTAIASIAFRVRAVVIDKFQLEKRFTGMSGPDLTIAFIAHLTLRASTLDIASDVLIVDGATPAFCRALRVHLSAACRESKRVRPFHKIVGGRSKHEDGLQLADMIAGATCHHVMRVGRADYQSFATKVVDLWEVSESEE